MNYPVNFSFSGSSGFLPTGERIPQNDFERRTSLESHLSVQVHKQLRLILKVSHLLSQLYKIVWSYMDLKSKTDFPWLIASQISC